MTIEETRCPDCNSLMISRKSQHGIFWGCVNYPKCKGTRDSMGRSKAERDKYNEEKEDKEDDTTNPKRRW